MADDRCNLLLVPGLNCTDALFAPQVAALSDIAICHIADHGTAPDLAAIAREILNAAPPSFALAGLSMGGYVAFELLRQAPHRVTRLCLLDTRAAMDSAEEAERRRRTIVLAQGGQFAGLHDILWPRLVHPSRTADRALEQVVLGMMQDTGPDRFARQQTAVLNRRDYAAVVKAISVPTLIVVGDQDVITPPEASEAMRDMIATAALVRIPDCGHLSTLECPETISQLMRQWLTA